MTTPDVACAVLSTAVALVSMPSWRQRRRLRRLRRPGPASVVVRQPRVGGGRARLARAVAALGVAAVVAGLVGAQVAVVLVTGQLVVEVAVWLRSGARRRAEVSTRRGQVIEACAVLAAELRAGRIPREALDAAATACAELAEAVAVARLGGDVATVLDRIAVAPGAGGLRALAAAWRVAEQSGSAFAAVAERIADSLRADELVRRQVSAGLAGARATARLLAGLPVLGIGLGQLVGADPLTFLTGRPYGRVCLMSGLLLATVGLAWVERLADSCERRTGASA